MRVGEIRRDWLAGLLGDAPKSRRELLVGLPRRLRCSYSTVGADLARLETQGRARRAGRGRWVANQVALLDV